MTRNFATTKSSGTAITRSNMRAFSTEAGKMNLSKKMGIDNIPHLIKDKRVLMRVDFNVPMKDG
jgi:3-phosphoglycerate kinase